MKKRVEFLKKIREISNKVRPLGLCMLDQVIADTEGYPC